MRVFYLAVVLIVSACILDTGRGRSGLGEERGGEDDDCTLTQGYWKNHEENWPVTSLTIGGQVYTDVELLTILWTPPQGDTSLILAHQLIAALLNVALGATAPPAVQTALSDAEAWMLANADSDGRLPYGSTDGAATAIADALAAFNEGQSGTEHCDDPPTSSSSTTSTSGSGGESTTSSSGSGGSGGCPETFSPCTMGECPLGSECVDDCCIPILY